MLKCPEHGVYITCGCQLLSWTAQHVCDACLQVLELVLLWAYVYCSAACCACLTALNCERCDAAAGMQSYQANPLLSGLDSTLT